MKDAEILALDGNTKAEVERRLKKQDYIIYSRDQFGDFLDEFGKNGATIEDVKNHHFADCSFVKTENDEFIIVYSW